MNLRLPPSLERGFARNKSQAAYPWLWDGLEAAWEFGLGFQGATPFDFSGNGHHGSVTAGFGTNLVWEVTPYGWGMRSNASATSDRISITSLPTGTFWTWECRLKINTFTDSWESLFSQGAAIGIYMRAAQVMNILFAAGSMSSVTNFNTGQWYHLVLVARGTEADLYVDGKHDRNATSVTPSFSADSMFNDSGSETFDGVFAYQRFWKRSFTLGEIQAVFQGASPMVLRQRDFATLFDDGGGAVDGTALPFGVTSGGRLGNLLASGDGNIGVSGVVSGGRLGSVTVSGDAVATAIGLVSGGRVGSLTTSGDALVTPIGVVSGGRVGDVTISLTGDGTAIITGVTSGGRVGSFVLSGDALRAITGVLSGGRAGVATASNAVHATAIIAGVCAGSRLGIVTPSGVVDTQALATLVYELSVKIEDLRKLESLRGRKRIICPYE